MASTDTVKTTDFIATPPVMTDSTPNAGNSCPSSHFCARRSWPPPGEIPQSRHTTPRWAITFRGRRSGPDARFIEEASVPEIHCSFMAAGGCWLMLKPVVRAFIRRVKTWIHEGSEPDPVWWLESDFVSDHLNYHLRQIRKARPNLRPHFAWGALSATWLAKVLGLSRISVIEFGVAGGNGLVELEQIATEVSAVYGVAIDVFGFDTGVGLPKPIDYRDVPNLYRASGFRMDEAKLRGRLKGAHLILGDLADTISTFMSSAPAPVGFVAVDVDLYSSTMAAFKLFDGDPTILLPRVYCYLDDILGETFSEFTGERLAVMDFNGAHPMRKISPIFGLRYFLREPHQMEAWPDQMFIAHLFDHELYERYAGTARDAGGWTELQ
jgi:hypothetical protein